MKIVVGDMWNTIGSATILLVTTNACINMRGELVMGRGAALQMKQNYPGIEQTLARKIQEKGAAYKPWADNTPPYGIVSAGQSDRGTHLGAFQVKWSWDQEADLSLIEFSTTMLCKIAPKYERVVLNYPGIGYGRLTRRQVEPILAKLPDNVEIYTLK